MVIENSKAVSAIIGGSKYQIRGRFEGQDTIGQKMDNTTRRQCAVLLTSLMKHPVGWVFNQPVDPVKLKIPDYFCIISKPMDLGTIKCKLERREYSSTLQFVSDVRLTFSNAMRYNPPDNDVHIMAKELFNIFLSRWKSLEDKWRKASTDLHQAETERVQKQTITSRQVMRRKSVPSSTVKRKCVEASLQAPCKGSSGIKLRIVPILDDPLAVSNKDKAIVATSACTNGSGVYSCSRQYDCSQASSSDIESERSSGSGKDEGAQGGFVPDSGHKNNSIGIAVLEDNAQAIQHLTCSPASAKNDDFQLEKLSPTKALRAAKLKRRFADTIVKARQKIFPNNGEHVDHEKMQRERERLEKEQREEKARIEAQVRAAEAAAAAANAARMRAETQAIMQRKKERQAARLALQKMEKTVNFDENNQIMKELESLCHARPGYFLGIPDGMAMNSMDGLESQCGLRSPLEKLGLFIKDDDLDLEADDWITTAGNGDMEEGEIGWITAVGSGDMEEGEINCL